MKISHAVTVVLLIFTTGCGMMRHGDTAGHMHTLAQGIELYKEEFNALPSPEAQAWFREITGMNPKKIVFVSPQDPERSAEAFLDAWNRPIHFSRKDQGYALKSAGKDGVLGTADDVIIER